MSSRTVLTSSDIDRAVTRISHEIVEANRGTSNLLILGIPTRGVWLAERIAKAIQEKEERSNLFSPTDVVYSILSILVLLKFFSIII